MKSGYVKYLSSALVKFAEKFPKLFKERDISQRE
jgi:hypothetical protein